MFGSTTLEVAIGIIFIFILFSTICSSIREVIEGWLKSRAAYLEFGIRELLKDKTGTGLAKSLYEHPQIFGLFSGDYTPGSTSNKPPILAGGKQLPSYIPSKNFAIALMDIAARGPKTDAISSAPGSPIMSLDSIRRNVLNLDNQFVQRALLTAIDTAQGDLNAVERNIEAWYDSSMDRVSGWYRRSTQWILFWVGLVLAVSLNVNTITIADYLFRHQDERTALVARAAAAASDTTNQLNYYEARAALDSLGLPVGWSAGWGAPRRQDDSGYTKGLWNYWLGPLFGFLITALAAMLGAPFWFDMLNKIMVIRSTVKPHEKSQEEASEDRQSSGPKILPIVADGGNNSDNPPFVPTSSSNTIPPDNETTISNVTPNIPNDDNDSDKDGCGIGVSENDITRDEHLPPAKGGITSDTIYSNTYSLTWLPQVLLNAGLKVAPTPGWEARGHGDVKKIIGVICHHTAGPREGNMPSMDTLIYGRSKLKGPLAQLGLGRDGTFYVIAAGKCWHAGDGTWKAFEEERSQGYISGNSNCIGIEAENTGLDNDKPWPFVQIDAYHRGVAAILRYIGKDETFCASHREYAPKRKTDPDINMNDFRNKVAEILKGTAPAPILIPASESAQTGGAAGRPTLRRGDRGDVVKQLQTKLQIRVDGIFGVDTEAVVRAFQRSCNIVPDGIVGPKTWKVLDTV